MHIKGKRIHLIRHFTENISRDHVAIIPTLTRRVDDYGIIEYSGFSAGKYPTNDA
jgi:hypothetical protein